jgi:hypothetical protein
MPKAAKGISEGWHPLLILEIATKEGHPVLDTEINNLLFRENWKLEASYKNLFLTLRA